MVVAAGILAAVVVPAFKDTDKSVLAGMRSDLRSLGTAQEEFFRHAQRYADAIADTSDGDPGRLRAEPEQCRHAIQRYSDGVGG